MNLTQQQRELLRVLVKNDHLGEFIFSRTHAGDGLIYTRGKGTDIPGAMDLSDFDQLASEGMITFSRFGKNHKGKVTQKGIDAVASDLGLAALFTKWSANEQSTQDDAAKTALLMMGVPRSPEDASPRFGGHPASWPAQRKKMDADLAELGVPRSIEEEALPSPQQKEPVVFIGHGRARDWRDLRDFLKDDLAIACIDFNSDDAVGMATKERLEQMLNQATFAFLVMTAEDEHSDGKHHARANVIHEAGLFQGKLGFDKAILLLEEGCAEFSNIHGLTHISFRKGDIEGAFHKIRKKLAAAKIIER